MKRNPENEKFIKLGATLIVVVLIGLAAAQVLSQGGAILGMLGNIGTILTPFLYGAVIAYLLAPVCNFLEKYLGKLFGNRKGLISGLSILFALLFALLIIVVLLALVIPSLVSSVSGLISALPSELQSFNAWLHEMLEANPDLQEAWDETAAEVTAAINSWLSTDLSPMLQSLIAMLSSQVMNIVNIAYNLFLGILISIYMLGSRRKFAVQARLFLGGLVPKKWADVIEEEVHYADRMFNGFLMGRIVDAVIVGVICFIFTALCGFESAVLVSVIVGVTNTIPLFGPYLGAIPSAIILLLEDPMHCLIFIVFILILQQVDGNLIGPRVVGQKTGVSSFWVLFSVLLFGGLWGIVGMIIGVPLFAVIYDIVKKLIYIGLRHWKRDDLLPPESAAPEPAGPESSTVE